jgi:hypothetical protein
MDQQTRRRLIQGKLLDGTLPYDSIRRVWGGSGHWELCDGCDEIIEQVQLLMEGINAKGQGIQFHVECFYIWDHERRVGGDGGAPLERIVS